MDIRSVRRLHLSVEKTEAFHIAFVVRLMLDLTLQTLRHDFGARVGM